MGEETGAEGEARGVDSMFSVSAGEVAFGFNEGYIVPYLGYEAKGVRLTEGRVAQSEEVLARAVEEGFEDVEVRTDGFVDVEVYVVRQGVADWDVEVEGRAEDVVVEDDYLEDHEAEAGFAEGLEATSLGYHHFEALGVREVLACGVSEQC